jgi:predicted chitinase
MQPCFPKRSRIAPTGRIGKPWNGTMTPIDRKAFHDRVRTALFDGRLAGAQVAGMEAMLDRWEAIHAANDLHWLAYMLATAFHETSATMQPVRETLAASDAGAAARLERAWARGRLGAVTVPYWRADADGKYRLGRGLVQLTHRANYERMSREIGIDLVADPGRAMEMDVAVAILFAGMEKGLFTGRRLGDYFAAGRTDWVNARRIVNGLDRAEQVAGYGRIFLRALGGADAMTH